jgi:predicted TIM-barrel fold metal-dependent hydrolase
MTIRSGVAVLALTVAMLATAPLDAAAQRSGPKVDHHQHLLSPGAAEMLAGSATPVTLPHAIKRLLDRRTLAWNDPKALAQLYAEKAILTEDEQVVGRAAVAEHVGTRFARPYKITPLAYSGAATSGQLAALYTRGEGQERKTVGIALITFAKERTGRWVIGSEAMKFPGPGAYSPIDANQLVKLLDEAEIERAVVLSIAYMFESPFRPNLPNASAKLRAENEWTAAQVGRYPARLIGFCSVNPLTDTALPEVERCKNVLKLSGLKLHLGNSRVDFKNPQHIDRVKRVAAAANRLQLPIVAHLWNGPEFGRQDAQLFLEQVLPEAPDVTVQIAHLAGGGPGWTDEALEVFAEAVARRDPRTRNLYFDLATVADLQSHEQLQLLARRIRQIGVERIVYGSDAAFGGRNTPDQEWGTFRGMVPLTDAEFAVIRENVAPYVR